MARFEVGPSSYGDLKRVMQFVNSQLIAVQFLSLKIDFDRLPSSRATGARLTVNEGMRSRARQLWLYAMRFVLAIVVAIPFTSRHDEVLRGNAMDIGVTMPDGSNRALTPAEFAWMHQQAELRGFTWTGRNFGEPWHIEGSTRPWVKPPYAYATVAFAFGPIDQPIPGTTPPTAPAPEPEPEPKEFDMPYGIKSKATGHRYVIWETLLDTIRADDKTETAAAVSQARGVAFVEMSSKRCKLLLSQLDARVAESKRIDSAVVSAAIRKALADEPGND